MMKSAYNYNDKGALMAQNYDIGSDIRPVVSVPTNKIESELIIDSY